MTKVTRFSRFLGLFACLSLLSACGGFGLFGGDDSAELDTLKADLADIEGVNPYLWRAALESLAALPISSTDSEGGVILTDWFINPDVANERTRVSVYVLDDDLRADAIDVNVVRQVLRDGRWVAASVQEGTELKIEDTILSRARELRIRVVEQD